MAVDAALLARRQEDEVHPERGDAELAAQQLEALRRVEVQGGVRDAFLHGHRSMMTVVDFTTAVASAPGSSASSSAASRDISDTIRYGPQASSTLAMTPSTSTPTTTPASRLRALEWPAPARARSSPASVSAGRKRWPPSRTNSTPPPRSQRRRVAALTPSALAAAPMRTSSTTRR